MSRISTSKHASQSKTLSNFSEHLTASRILAVSLARLIAQHGVGAVSEKTGIKAKDLLRYAKGAPLNKSSMNKLLRLADRAGKTGILPGQGTVQPTIQPVKNPERDQ